MIHSLSDLHLGASVAGGIRLPGFLSCLYVVPEVTAVSAAEAEESRVDRKEPITLVGVQSLLSQILV